MPDYETPEYKAEIENLIRITNDFMSGLWFCIHDTGRDHEFWDKHLFSYISQDIIQSSYSIYLLAREGITNPCKRELRFLLELTIKQCYIEQQMPRASVTDKLDQYSKLLNSPSISIKSDITLSLLPAATKDTFLADVGRFYGVSSKYVHLSSQQVEERIELLKRGITVGKEGVTEIKDMIQSIRLGYSLVLTLIYHSIPSYVAGDWLVDSDGSSNKWYFGKSKYIAGIDSYFDYKHERKSDLQEIQKKREANIEF